MHKSIRVLPRELAEKIAAGEVVERPASVVKELVENSLDAGARRIRVELEDGGRKRITVLDDGHGIAAPELELALERHATSKISELDDLWNLRTMGFRGEALPSIAAISRFTIESRVANAAGRKLSLEGGRIERDTAAEATSPLAAFASGTLITVADLFYNVPARLNFMRSKASEGAQIRELLERIALCNPTVAFSLLTDGRKALTLEASDEPTRVARVLEATRDTLDPVEAMFENITVRGWVDRDGRASNSRHVYLAVNGRMVRDKLLQQAVLVALRSRMMEGEYPRLFLSVEVGPGDVDVNVHPAKSEVRFRKARDVFQVVHGALERLAREPARAFYAANLPATATKAPTDSFAGSTTESMAAAKTPPPPGLFPNDRISYRTKEHVGINLGGLTAAFETEPDQNRNGTQTETETETETETANRIGNEKRETAPRRPGFSHLQYVGQVKNTYLLFQDRDGLVLIDQHAAHERINYEKLKSELLDSGLKPQPLLVSAVVRCKSDELALALDASEFLGRLGYEFEAFGENCLLLRAAPAALAPDRAVELFKALLEELRDADGSTLGAPSPTSLAHLSPKLERMLSTSACHASVRAGQALSPREARELVDQMEETESALNCPHGRPASVKLTFSQLEAMFKR